MQLHGDEQANLLNEAAFDAQVLLRSVPAGVKLRLLNGRNGQLTKAAFQSQLDELRFQGGSPWPALGAVGGTSNGAVYVLSDFQKNGFNAKGIEALGTQQQVTLVPLVGKKAGNVYVDSVWLDDAFVRVRANVGLHVRLRNGGNVTVTDCPVKIFVGARQVAAFRKTVAAGQALTTVVQVQLAEAALALGRVVTEDVPVTFDNTYYFTLQPAAPIRVLEIGAVPVTQRLYENEPLFTYSFAKPQNLDYGVLRQANLVVVREVGEVDAGLRDGLRAVVKRGGSVVVVPTALAKSRDSYQQLFKALGVGAAQWEAPAAVPELRELAVPTAGGAFFRDVFGAQPRVATMPRVAPVLRWARTGTDILRLRDGESYLAEFENGAGRVYVFSAPFAPEYADFMAHALFVPVMYRMAMLSYRNEQLPAYRLNEGTVALALPAAGGGADGGARADEASIRLVMDSVTLIPAQRTTGQEVRLQVPQGMDAPGFYQVQRAGKVLTTLAFNQSKRESELAAYSAAELRELIGPNRPNIRVVEGGPDGSALAALQEAETGKPLWRYFLALALAALLAEALLVRFGNRAGKPAAAAVPA